MPIQAQQMKIEKNCLGQTDSIGQAQEIKPRSNRAFAAVAGVDGPSLSLTAGEVLWSTLTILSTRS